MPKVSIAFALFVLMSLPASAQEKSSWGVQASTAPRWELLPQVQDLFDAELDLRGGEFTLGVVRGRTLGGDWGVSFVRKSIDDTSVISERREDCGGFPMSEYRCFETGTSYRLRHASLTGLEAHKYIPFVTIRKRVQVGMNFGGGVAWVRGTSEKKDVTLRIVTQQNPPRIIYQPVEAVTTISAAEAMKEEAGFSTLPTGRAELVIALIAAPGLKIKVSGGVGAPSYSRFGIGAAYLF